MPRRANPGDLAKIEATLTEHDLRTLGDLCELRGQARDRWQDVPAWEQTFTSLAVLRRAQTLRVQRGLARTPSIAAAADELGVSVETSKARLRVRESAARSEHSVSRSPGLFDLRPYAPSLRIAERLAWNAALDSTSPQRARAFRAEARELGRLIELVAPASS